MHLSYRCFRSVLLRGRRAVRLRKLHSLRGDATDERLGRLPAPTDRTFSANDEASMFQRKSRRLTYPFRAFYYLSDTPPLDALNSFPSVSRTTWTLRRRKETEITRVKRMENGSREFRYGRSNEWSIITITRDRDDYFAGQIEGKSWCWSGSFTSISQFHSFVIIFANNGSRIGSETFRSIAFQRTLLVVKFAHPASFPPPLVPKDAHNCEQRDDLTSTG